MKINTKTKLPPVYTAEGGKAVRISVENQLRRSVMACMLWENQFYESGQTIADRIASLVPHVDPTTVMEMAIEARSEMNLRHVPLLLARVMAALPTHKSLVAHTLEQVIQRPDEITEFLALYWATNDGKKSLSAQIKRGLAAAFGKFNEYNFAKYDRDADVRLRDALFLSHAKPADTVKRYTRLERKESPREDLTARETLYKKIADGTLATPDTWEVALSAIPKTDRTAVLKEWTRLLNEDRLGALALLRNLRNMRDAGVSKRLVAEKLLQMKTERVLPYRFIAAARAVPEWEDIIEPAMLNCLSTVGKINKPTVLLIDVSGSMDERISAKSDLTRLDAACGLAILAREMYEDIQIFTFSRFLAQLQPRHGFALRDAVVQSQAHLGTYLQYALTNITVPYERIIVITDEQSHDGIAPPRKGSAGYVINVASARNGVGYGPWNHIDGWSEAVLRYIQTLEAIAD